MVSTNIAQEILNTYGIVNTNRSTWVSGKNFLKVINSWVGSKWIKKFTLFIHKKSSTPVFSLSHFLVCIEDI
jgi:hypothetical protein